MRALIRQVSALAWRLLQKRLDRNREPSSTRDIELRATFRRERQRLETERLRQPRRR